MNANMMTQPAREQVVGRWRQMTAAMAQSRAAGVDGTNGNDGGAVGGIYA